MANEKFTVERMIEAIAAAKGLVSPAARILRCSPTTVKRYIAQHPTVAQAVKDERDQVLDVAELALYKKIQDGEGWAVCFALKTIGKDRGYVERNEHANAPGEDFRVLVQPGDYGAAVAPFLPPGLTDDDAGAS
jgi:hypothetical protein